jgi:hypothetical protein
MGCCGAKNKIFKKGTEKNNIENYRSDVLIKKNFGMPKNEVDRKRKLAILKKQGKL